MRGYRVMLAVLLVCLISTTYSVTAQNTDCLLNLPPRFVKGMRGKLTEHGQTTRTITIRRNFASDSNAIGILRTEDAFTATGEVGCSERMYWQSIVTDKGLAGFVAESDRSDYFIEPISTEIYRFGHGKAYGVSWSPDSKMLAIGSTLGVWLYTDKLEPIRLMPGYDDGVRAVAWSPDGSKIATANSDKTVQLWDVASGKSITLLRHLDRGEGNEWWDGSITWSPDSTKFASAGLDGTVRIWDVKAEKQLTALYHDGAVYSVAWHRDGKRLASGGMLTQNNRAMGTIWVWNTETGQQTNTISPLSLQPTTDGQIPIQNVVFLQWIAESETLAASAPFGVNHAEQFTWNVGTTRIESIPTERSRLSIRYSPDGKRLAELTSNGLYITDASTYRVETYDNLDPRLVAWSQDSRLFAIQDVWGGLRITDGTSSDSGNAKIIAGTDDFGSRLLPRWVSVNGEDIITDGYEAFSLSSNRNITLTPTPIAQTATPAVTPTLDNPHEYRNYLTSNTDNTLHVEEYRLAGISIGNPDDPSDDALDDHSRLRIYVGNEEKLVLETPSQVERYTYEISADWSQDGKYIAVTDKTSNGNSYLAIWDANTGKLRLFKEINSLTPQWHSDSTRVLLASPPLVVNLSGNILFSLDATHGEWSPDWTRIFTTDEKRKVFRIWDGNSGALRQTISSELVEPSTNERIVAFGGDQLAIQIWDMNNEQQLITLHGLTVPATIMAWQPDNKRLAVASEDHVIRIWDVATGKLVQTIGAHRMPIRSIVWKDDGTQLYSTSDDGTLRLWDVR